ncbi:MAG TPA: hemolysin III family protein, partial [Mycobacterium sp.]|nr:hemolysin III family protein [Mycobacterium sp.]
MSVDTAEFDQVRSPTTHVAEDLPEAFADGVAHILGKPRARGWIHVYAAVIAIVAGAALVSVSWAVESTRAGVATLIYTFT